MKTKSDILQIVFKYQGSERILQLKLFQDGLKEQKKLVGLQIKHLDKIINHELENLKI